MGSTRHTLCTEMCQGWALKAPANHSVKTASPRGLVRRVKGGSPGSSDRRRDTGQRQKLEAERECGAGLPQLLSSSGDQRGFLRTPL